MATISVGARDAAFNVALIHPFDVRGTKVGGLETYIRDFITFCPDDIRVLFVGVDAAGDLPLGRITELSFRGRRFDFLPVLHYEDEKAREAARALRQSITAQFFVALVRHFPSVAKALLRRRCSVDLRRVEFAWLPVLLRLPYIQMLHGEGVPRLRMDSLLRNYRAAHLLNERFAVATARKFLCVNPMITERMRQTYPRHAAKVETLWTWVNTQIYKPAPFPALEPFRIVFIGRLDEFKVPPLMFATIARLRERLGGGVEFHYVGTSNPGRFAEFADIKDVTVLHGFKDPPGVADVLKNAHAGILTSEFEGMPRCVLETIAVGRPVVAVHLPQLEAVIHEGVSGYLVPRGYSEQAMASELADRFLILREAIATGRIDPSTTAAAVSDFTPDTQLARVYRMHRDIQRGGLPRVGAIVGSTTGRTS